MGYNDCVSTCKRWVYRHETVVWVVCMMLMISAIIGVTSTLTFAAQRYNCEKVAHKAGVEWNYSVPTGCMYKINGNWVPKRTWVVNTGN